MTVRDEGKWRVLEGKEVSGELHEGFFLLV